METRVDIQQGDPQHNAAGVSGSILDNRRIAGAAAVVMLFFVFSRVTGLVREMVIAAYFGAGAELDAYLAAFRVPDLLFQLVAGGALGSAFIPMFSTYWSKSDAQSAWLLFSRVLNLVTLALMLVAGLAIVFALPLVQLVIAPGFAPAQQVLTAQLMRWMLVSTVIFGASGLVMGALNAVQHFLLPAVAPVFYNLAIILGAWLLSPALGVYGVVLGVVMGALVHLLIQLPGLWQVGARYTWSLYWRDAGVREVARLMGPRALGLFFVQMHFLVNTVLASGLAAGSLVALNYAWLLMLLPQGIFAQSIATAVFPTLAAQIAVGQVDAMRRTFSQALRTVLFLAIPAAVGLYVLRVPLIEALFQRGKFNPASTQLVAYALQFYVIGLAAHAAVEIAVRAFYALHNTLTPVLVGTAAMMLNIGLSVWWVRGLGYGGLALANSTATTLEMAALLWLLRRHMNGIEGWKLLTAVGRQLSAALIMGCILWLWLRWFPLTLWADQRVWGAGLTAVGGLVIGAFSYAAVGLLLRSEELLSVLTMVLRRLAAHTR
jgi:putative peptidoglycan lipid II flippase